MSFTPMTDVPNPLFDSNGDPFSGAVLKAYLPGTTTAISIYTDATGSSPQATLTANAQGAWEVTGSEVVPYIDQDHKWGIFANASDAASNTPFYMGPFDNVTAGIPLTSPNLAIIFDNVADLVSGTLPDGSSITLTAGQTATTLGELAIGDELGNDYTIGTFGVANGKLIIDLDSGLQAQYLGNNNFETNTADTAASAPIIRSMKDWAGDLPFHPNNFAASRVNDGQTDATTAIRSAVRAALEVSDHPTNADIAQAGVNLGNGSYVVHGPLLRDPDTGAKFTNNMFPKRIKIFGVGPRECQISLDISHDDADFSVPMFEIEGKDNSDRVVGFDLGFFSIRDWDLAADVKYNYTAALIKIMHAQYVNIHPMQLYWSGRQAIQGEDWWDSDMWGGLLHSCGYNSGTESTSASVIELSTFDFATYGTTHNCNNLRFHGTHLENWERTALFINDAVSNIYWDTGKFHGSNTDSGSIILDGARLCEFNAVNFSVCGSNHLTFRDGANFTSNGNKVVGGLLANAPSFGISLQQASDNNLFSNIAFGDQDVANGIDNRNGVDIRDVSTGHNRIEWESLIKAQAITTAGFPKTNSSSATPTVKNLSLLKHGFGTLTGLLGASVQQTTKVVFSLACTVDFTSNWMYGNSGVDFSAEPRDHMTCTLMRDASQTVSSITQAAGTATATVVTHGLVVGQEVEHQGADQDDYNGVHVVLSTPTADTYTFAVDSGATTPATGSIFASAYNWYCDVSDNTA